MLQRTLTKTDSNDPVEVLETIIEGWGGKQGFHFPTWKARWFVLQKRRTPRESDDVTDCREYFKNSSDSFERAHNYNVKNDKVNLILSYYTDETKSELKEEFRFDENTSWLTQQSRVTIPKFRGGPISSIHLFCKGSRGAHKLIFIPFWGFVEPTYNLMCQPWSLCMEFGKPRAYDGENDTYFHDFITVKEDTFGQQQKDMDAKLETFKGLFADDVVFKDIKANVVRAVTLLAPIKFFGKNAQEDDLGKDKADQEAALSKQTEWQMKFDKKFAELQEEKQEAGGRAKWLKLNKQAQHRNMKFKDWMAIKDQDDNIANLPAHLQ
mmetsp:Transcript_68236/g.134134  ORF Transcript_68236/g.134134 Transcript_68236/m.134134 type:complete len:323 (+) Transcript_68236:18-986(+)